MCAADETRRGVIAVAGGEGGFARLGSLGLGLPLVHLRHPRQALTLTRVELLVYCAEARVEWSELLDLAARHTTVVAAQRYDDRDALEALSNGLMGYVDLRQDPQACRGTFLAVLAGSPAYRDVALRQWLHGRSERSVANERVRMLTSRQREVLALVARGAADKEIGRELGISTPTVQKHVTNILSRLSVPNRAAAAVALGEARIVPGLARRGR